ncbi:MAG TPA: hypothetical protein ENI80_00185 [Acidiferrobacteraceae bacterium]|nr:hypothetical protein [Acidiferrobacteraceae bacterium]
MADLTHFYAIVEGLSAKSGGTRLLSESTGRMDWPVRGVYFFQEPGESRTDTGPGPRIVRVGTHALKAGSRTTLWNRLSQHKGSAKTGGGNHRGSIFRLIVGTALVDLDGHVYPTWGQGSSAPKDIPEKEQPLEQLVSKSIREMPFLCLEIADEPGPNSLRGYIERNTIALLSNYNKLPADAASPQWLGHHCNREKVRNSGIWNQNHVDEDYDPVFLDELERLVSEMGHTP